jgi:hypothetical protein
MSENNNQWYDPNAVDQDGDGLVQDGTKFQRPARQSRAEEPAEEPAVVELTEEQAAVVYAAPAEEPAEEPAAPEEPAVVVETVVEVPAAAPVERTVDSDAVDVVLSALSYPGVNKNSASVRRMQYQLYQAGFVSVTADREGLYSTGTFDAVASFQAANSLDSTGVMNAATLEKLFENESGVRLVL